MKCQVRLVKDIDTKNKHRGRWRSFNRFLVVTEILADSPAQIYKAPYSGSQQGRLNRFQRMRLTSLLRCRGEIQLFFVWRSCVNKESQIYIPTRPHTYCCARINTHTHTHIHRKHMYFTFTIFPLSTNRNSGTQISIIWETNKNNNNF